MSEDSRLDADIEPNLEYMSNFVIWPFEISDGDISAAIENYALPFEPWNLWGCTVHF